MKKVIVVTPLYRPELSEHERMSLEQTVRVLGRWPMTLIVPEGMDTTDLRRDFPTLGVKEVSNEWLGEKNGIAGYNEMMLSADFYGLFGEYDYLLVCHTDAWIFRDELAKWCDKGYDCVAAPWPRRKRYSLPLLRQWLAIRRCLWRRRILRQELWGRVGNGGLSLRRVEPFRRVCTERADEIKRFRMTKDQFGNEDVFWATMPHGFRYPTWEEALGFAFDTKPDYCYKRTGNRLPMGCHGWSKPQYFEFWKPLIF